MGKDSRDEAKPEEQVDPDRDAILRRRKRFLAVALSGAAVSAALGGCQPCLSPPAPLDGGPDGGPDAAVDGGADASTDDGGADAATDDGG